MAVNEFNLNILSTLLSLGLEKIRTSANTKEVDESESVERVNPATLKKYLSNAEASHLPLKKEIDWVVDFEGKENYRAIYNPIERLTPQSSAIINKMKSFSKLESNWDSYGAEPISWKTIISAIEFFLKTVNAHPDAPLPFVAPAPDGSIHFEWERSSSKLTNTIPIDESNDYVYIISGVFGEESGTVYGLNNMFEVFSKWILPNERRNNPGRRFSIQESTRAYV